MSEAELIPLDTLTLDRINNDLRVKLCAGNPTAAQEGAEAIWHSADQRYGEEIKWQVLANTPPELLRPLARTALILGESLAAQKQYDEADARYKTATVLNGQRSLDEAFGGDLSAVTILCAKGRTYGLWGKLEPATFTLQLALNGANAIATKLPAPAEHTDVGDTSRQQSLQAARQLVQTALEVLLLRQIDGEESSADTKTRLTDIHGDLQLLMAASETPIAELEPVLGVQEAALALRKPPKLKQIQRLLGRIPSSVVIDWPSGPNAAY